MIRNKQYSQFVTVFHDYPLPETKAKPVGYIALIADYGLSSVRRGMKRALNKVWIFLNWNRFCF
jgi:hypothetical protein